jgi:hypothetical protein
MVQTVMAERVLMVCFVKGKVTEEASKRSDKRGNVLPAGLACVRTIRWWKFSRKSQLQRFMIAALSAGLVAYEHYDGGNFHEIRKSSIFLP